MNGGIIQAPLLATFADQLVGGGQATLDLGGLNRYVHAAQIDPTAQVTGGTLTVIPSGGPLVLGKPISAALVTVARPTTGPSTVRPARGSPSNSIPTATCIRPTGWQWPKRPAVSSA